MQQTPQQRRRPQLQKQKPKQQQQQRRQRRRRNPAAAAVSSTPTPAAASSSTTAASSLTADAASAIATVASGDSGGGGGVGMAAATPTGLAGATLDYHAASAVAAAAPSPAPSAPPTVPDFTVQFGTPGWERFVGARLRDLGVAVVRGVFSPEECTRHMCDLVEDHYTMCPELREGWTDARCPPGPRSGLFQSLSMHFPPVWRVRTDPRVRTVFEAAYHGVRGRRITDFVSSCDGINIRPYAPPFFDADTSQDWAHLDQTTTAVAAADADPFRCVQGQVVLSNSSACFRASPGSVRAFVDISAATRKNCRRPNWNLFRQGQYARVRDLVLAAGGAWQLPVQAPRGAMILWLSSTVHSACLQAATPAPRPTPADPYNGWRGVVYVCLRPQEDVDDVHLRRIADCVRYNRCSNHWGDTVFNHKAGTKFGPRPARMLRYIGKPHLLRLDHPELAPEMTDAVRALITRAPETSARPRVVAASQAAATAGCAGKAAGGGGGGGGGGTGANAGGAVTDLAGGGAAAERGGKRGKKPRHRKSRGRKGGGGGGGGSGSRSGGGSGGGAAAPAAAKAAAATTTVQKKKKKKKNRTGWSQHSAAAGGVGSWEGTVE